MSNEELLVVVDDDDNILDYLPRKEVHQKNLLHRTISIITYNSKGQIILQKRSMSMDTYPGMYTNAAGGHVLKGQSYEETARKELKEELGLEIEPKLIKKILIDDPIHRTVTCVYEIVHDGEFKINEEEIERIDYFNKEDLVGKINQISGPAKIMFEKLGILK